MAVKELVHEEEEQELCGCDGCCEHEHEHDHECECGCEHHHEHEHGCTCDHDHDHEHECDCEHHHEHGHDHHHDHEHHHHHDHGSCSCGCDHDHVPETRELSEEPTLSYHVLDIDCPSCALNAQNAVRMLKCVKDARIVYATSTLDVVLEEGADSFESRREILKTIRSCGQDLDLSQEELEELSAQRSWYQENRERLLMCISGMALVAGLVADRVMGNEVRAIPFYVIAAVAGLVFVAPMAFASLRRRTADMNVLMGIAVLGGLIMGFTGDPSTFEDAGIVILLYQIGEWLEGWSMRKTSGSIKELMDLAPELAHVVEGDAVHDEEVVEVEEGERIRVLPGERVPLDGIILLGSSAFNEAAITGESTPKDKGVGDEVFAGSLNTSGVVELEVTADEDCTMLSRIVSMVQGAQAEKAPYESFIDRFAAVYTPIVMGCAVVVGVGAPLVLSLVNGFSGSLWHDWVYRALSLLVVACPCALVISTPVSFVSAITRAAKNGVLVKGGAYFDIASKVTAMAFDKTGTLTTGRPAVVAVRSFAGATEREVIDVAHALEESSTHPLARAVVTKAHEAGSECVAAQDVRELAAQGVLGSVSGSACAIGKRAFACEQGTVGEDVDLAIEELSAQGATSLVVMRDGAAIGVIGIADSVRPEAAEAMAALRKAGSVKSLEMLTGDIRQAAEAVGRTVGVTHAVAELLPDGKVQYVRDLQAQGEVVAMVGDGINDAPALATADLAITMGAAASDTALEVADVALLSDDLRQLPRFVELSVRTMHVVMENICFAILVKALVFVLVIAGVAGMGAAVFADTGVALIVILNGMRLMIDSRSRW
ncbi:MAG: cation-translocating P-type ATPase [Atopobiaceae bacterium]|nr:cation-translocating P-type ATPase [Atopobiaceae bacterium]